VFVFSESSWLLRVAKQLSGQFFLSNQGIQKKTNIHQNYVKRYFSEVELALVQFCSKRFLQLVIGWCKQSHIKKVTMVLWHFLIAVTIFCILTRLNYFISLDYLHALSLQLFEAENLVNQVWQANALTTIPRTYTQL